MDALPMQEETGVAWRSRHDDRTHGCGHDGHTMLVAAARYLAETLNFDDVAHRSSSRGRTATQARRR
jgi:metal-dependent amidase/aminoacylase/carboxypeptidase family protein